MRRLFLFGAFFLLFSCLFVTSYAVVFPRIPDFSVPVGGSDSDASLGSLVDSGSLSSSEPASSPDLLASFAPVITPEPQFDPESTLGPAIADSVFPSFPYEGYLPPDEFFSSVSDYSVSVIAVQTTPNTPVDSSSGLKGILLQLFGPYSPTITQLRYQANTSSTYTYVNDISPDYPWIWSAVIFSIVLYCTFKLGGTFLCKT